MRSIASRSLFDATIDIMEKYLKSAAFIYSMYRSLWHATARCSKGCFKCDELRPNLWTKISTLVPIRLDRANLVGMMLRSKSHTHFYSTVWVEWKTVELSAGASTILAPDGWTYAARDSIQVKLGSKCYRITLCSNGFSGYVKTA